MDFPCPGPSACSMPYTRQMTRNFQMAPQSPCFIAEMATVNFSRSVFWACAIVSRNVVSFVVGAAFATVVDSSIIAESVTTSAAAGLGPPSTSKRFFLTAAEAGIIKRNISNKISDLFNGATFSRNRVRLNNKKSKAVFRPFLAISSNLVTGFCLSVVIYMSDTLRRAFFRVKNSLKWVFLR